MPRRITTRKRLRRLRRLKRQRSQRLSDWTLFIPKIKVSSLWTFLEEMMLAYEKTHKITL
jgi:hypothetical protein